LTIFTIVTLPSIAKTVGFGRDVSIDSIVATSTVGDGVGVDVIVGEAVAVGVRLVGVVVGDKVGVAAIVGVGVVFTPSNGSILSLKIKYPPVAIAPKIATVAAVATRGLPPL
jgi:hypothetical protein